jgi:hypothetical protein
MVLIRAIPGTVYLILNDSPDSLEAEELSILSPEMTNEPA